MKKILSLFFLLSILFNAQAQLFQDDFGTAFASIDAVKWPSSCRGGSASGFNTSVGSCFSTGDYNYGLSGSGSYITTQSISIPATGYSLTFNFSYNSSISFPTVQIRTGASCGTTLSSTTTLSNTSGVCTPQSISLNAYAGQTIYIRFVSNSSTSCYLDDIEVNTGGGGGGSCLLSDDFGTAFVGISTTNWPTGCRLGSPSSFNTSTGGCSGAGDYSYSMSGSSVYITSMALSIPTSGYTLSFNYSFSNTFSFPTIEIRSGGTCGTSLLATHTLSNTSGACTPFSTGLSAYAGQTIFIRFRSNTSTTFYIDDVNVCAGGSGGDFKWADNFNDNNLTLNYTGNDADEACSSCGSWTLSTGASLNLVPSSGWNGNTNKTEAFPINMANVYYVRLDRTEYIESPVIDLSGKESVKISFYAKSSSSGTGGGDNWSFSDNLKLQIWNGSAWITVKQISEGAVKDEDKISAALPFNYFCFSAYKSANSPGNYYYTTSPNVNSAYFHSGFKFRVLFEGGFSGVPFAWLDDFTFRADADGYSTMIPCGISFWNQPAASGYGRDPDATAFDDSERGVNLELDNSISFPPNWATQANDGDVSDQVFGGGESERVVFAVLSEQEIRFAFPTVSYYSPNTGWRSATMSIDNNYTGPGWLYYNVQYVSCDLASSSIAAPTDDYQYYYNFEYGNEFIPVFYQLNKSGIETGGGVTSLSEVFNAPDVTSSDDCGALPVELVSFSAKYKRPDIDLHWLTESETNNSGFAVERSVDGINFEKIGWQVALAMDGQGAGYDFVDNQGAYLGFPLLYYRLRQVDNNNTETFSKVVVVELPEKDPAINIYPNPVKDILHIDLSNIDLSNIFSLQVFNALGMEIQLTKEGNSLKSGLLQLDIRDLPAGIYTLRLAFGEAVQSLKFIKD